MLGSVFKTVTMANRVPDPTRSKTAVSSTELIALLDRYIFLQGMTITTQPSRLEMDLASLPPSDTPGSVQMSPPTSLNNDLRALEHERQEEGGLVARITVLSHDPDTIQHAHKTLDDEYLALPTQAQHHDKGVFTSKPLPEKLAMLRRMQQNAAQPLLPPTFRTELVIAVNSVGLPKIISLHLPLATDSREYLKEVGRKVRGMTDEAEFGEVKLLYQRIVAECKAEKELRVVSCEEEYKAMRVGMRKEGFGVLVWEVSFPLIFHFHAFYEDVVGLTCGPFTDIFQERLWRKSRKNRLEHDERMRFKARLEGDRWKEWDSDCGPLPNLDDHMDAEAEP